MSQIQAAHPKYRPDIDGLRAIAICSVIGFHTFPDIVPGGFIGVDIFFVISGYLISTIIFGNLEHNRFSIAEFYERRVRRIFPALIAVMLATITFGWYMLLTDEYKQLGRHVAAASLFIQNFALWNESGYFDTNAETKPLLHLWSLAIEEQFYIFWPLLLAWIWKYKGNFLYITLILATVSFASNIYLSISNPTADFYSPLSRCWQLMTGGILAYIQLHRPDLIKNHKNVQAALGCICLVVGLALVNKERAFPGWWSLLPTIGAFFIIAAGAKAWPNKHILSHRLMVGIGLISYPLYLWHWPILSFTKILRPYSGYKLKIGLIALACVLSTLTYLHIEKNFRKHVTSKSKILAQKTKAIYLVSGMSLILITGLLINFTEVLPRLYDGNIKVSYKNEWDFLKSISKDFDPNGTGIYTLGEEREKRTLFIGDSQLAQYAERVAYIQNKNPSLNGAIFAIGGGCPPIQNIYTDKKSRHNCWENRDKAFKLAMDKRTTTIVLGGSWNLYFLENGYYHLEGTEQQSLKTDIGAKKALDTLDNTISSLRKAGKKVYLLLGNPINDAYDPHLYANRLDEKNAIQIQRYAPLKENQAQLRQALLDRAKRSGVSVIDPYRILCKENMCERISEEGIALFKDSSHFNPDWALENIGYLDASLETLAN